MKQLSETFAARFDSLENELNRNSEQSLRLQGQLREALGECSRLRHQVQSSLTQVSSAHADVVDLKNLARKLVEDVATSIHSDDSTQN